MNSRDAPLRCTHAPTPPPHPPPAPPQPWPSRYVELRRKTRPHDVECGEGSHRLIVSPLPRHERLPKSLARNRLCLSDQRKQEIERNDDRRGPQPSERISAQVHLP